jgi:predicted ATPase
LVTVVGAGGVGKSRLAHAVAVDALDECEGGAWWVSLEPLGETSVVAAEIARALGASGPDAIAAVAARVAGRRTIVVLEMPSTCCLGSPEIARLLASTSDLTFLITSQRRLGVDVEFVIRVDQLVPGAARALFYERAATARRDLRIPLDVVDAICSRADHHPLTLELAAGRLAVLSPAQLLDRMDRLLPLLGGAEAGRRKSLSGSVIARRPAVACGAARRRGE